MPSTDPKGPVAAASPAAPREHGDDRYQLIAEHGRGGLGRIVRAHDRYLGRTVAVKELLRTSDLAERLFLREAMITARLEHPGIVPVHEAGRWPNGDPFYVMKLVSGRTLKEVIGAARSLGDRLALLPHLIAVADAVGYAHSEGVVHRDLKPTNVLVGEFGETVVIDWGLARDLRAPEGSMPDAVMASPDGVSPPGPAPTVTGRVIGTPQYMAPEQARGESVGTTADVYALGAILYELLSGHPPIEGDSVQELLDQVRAGPPRPLAQKVTGVPADLEAIVGKAMARAPEDRYPTARELAADLKRFQTGQLVTAQRYGKWRLLRRWLVRHRAWVGTGAMALVAIAMVAYGMLRDVVDERRVAEAQREAAVKAREKAEAGEAKLILAQARGSLATDPTTALAWIKQYPVSPVTASVVRELIDEAEAAGVAAQAWRFRGEPRALALSADGRRVVTADERAGVVVRDTGGGAARRLGEGRTITALALAPDSRTLWVGGPDGRLGRFDVATDGAAIELGAVDGPVTSLAVTADGSALVTTRTDAWRIDGGSGERTRLFPRATPLERLVWTTDERTGAVVLAHGGDGKLRLWRGGEGPTVVATVGGMPARLAVTADARHAVVATTSTLHLVDLAAGNVRHLLDLPAEVNRITIDPTERRAAVVTKAADVYLVGLASGDVDVKRGHSDGVYTAAFDARGDRMVTASDDGTVRVWDLPTGDVRELRGHRDDVFGAAVSADGHTVLSWSVDETLRVWRVDDRRTAVVGHLDDVRQIAPLGGDRVRVLSGGHGVRLVDVDLGKRSAEVRFHDPDALLVRSGMRRDGEAALLMRGPRDALLWRDGKARPVKLPPTATMKYTVTRGGRAFGVDLDGAVWRTDERVTTTIATAAMPGAYVVSDPDSESVLLQDRTGFRVIDAITGEVKATMARAQLGVSETAAASFVRGDCRIAIGGMDEAGMMSLRLWNPDTGEVVALAESSHAARDLLVSPDGRWLVGGVERRAVRVWDTRTGAVVRTLAGHRDLVSSMAFTPDGQRLATASYDRTLRVWDLATGERRVLSGHVGPVWGVTWLDGTRLASASGDGTVRLWTVPAMPPPGVDQLTRRLQALSWVEIQRDTAPGPATAADARPAAALSPG